jgi:hypothetical protein
MTKDSPWEVQLLLLMSDSDDYESYVDTLIDYARDGLMLQTELQRFLNALAQVRDEHERSLEQLKLLVNPPKVEFENGQWRISDQ